VATLSPVIVSGQNWTEIYDAVEEGADFVGVVQASGPCIFNISETGVPSLGAAGIMVSGGMSTEIVLSQASTDVLWARPVGLGSMVSVVMDKMS
jgi:hypothetical protein